VKEIGLLRSITQNNRRTEIWKNSLIGRERDREKERQRESESKKKKRE